MISRNQDNFQLRQARTGSGQKSEQKLLGGDGWIGGVIDVASNQQGIDVFAFERVEQPCQKALEFVNSVVLVQRVTKVPVRGMKKAQDASTWL